MAAGQLTARERKALRTVVSSTRDAKPLRQAQALLALDAGEKAKRVAQRVGINRSTVFQWRREFIDRRGEPVAGRLGDRPRSGRPRTAREVATKHVSALMDASPQEFGYRHTVWTVPLLRSHLGRVEDVKVSVTTLRRTLRDLGYRWKRPRYVLSRRSKTWRQAKGGSTAV
jgi:transposase